MVKYFLKMIKERFKKLNMINLEINILLMIMDKNNQYKNNNNNYNLKLKLMNKIIYL
jgi:hypothetical protein